MISSADFKAKFDSGTRDLVTGQTLLDITATVNTTNLVFDAVKGYGVAGTTTSAFLYNAGGWADQRIVAAVSSDQVAGLEDHGVVLRCSHHTLAHLYVRLSAGTLKIAESVAGVFTNLTSTAFAVASGVVTTLDVSVVGTLVTATATAASGPSPVTISATTNLTNVPAKGLMGVRSFAKGVWCRSIRVYEL